MVTKFPAYCPALFKVVYIWYCPPLRICRKVSMGVMECAYAVICNYPDRLPHHTPFLWFPAGHKPLLLLATDLMYRFVLRPVSKSHLHKVITSEPFDGYYADG